VTAVVIGEATYVKNTVTDRDGRALLLGLTKGRVRVSSGHSGFLSWTYGAERPGEDGTYITVAEGQQVPAITIRLKRGAVIAGTITNDAGEPMVGVNVQAFRRRFSGGRQVFTGVAEMDFTDDRGAYRIRNLIPGDYLVGVVPQTHQEVVTGGADTNAEDPMTFFDQAESRGLILNVEDGRLIMSQPLPLQLSDGRRLGYPPTFFPGAPASNASIITIGPSELRASVDFQLDPAPVVEVSGRIAGLLDHMLVRATLALVPVADDGRVVVTAQHTAVAGASGLFRFGFVSHGRYVLEVRANENIAGLTPMRASVPLSVTDVPLTDLVVPLNEGMTVRGQVRFSTGAMTSIFEQLRGVQVTLTRAPGEWTSGSAHSRGMLAGDASFEIYGLSPGDYIARVEGLPYGWLASTAMHDGRDTLDFGLHIEPGVNVEDLIVTVTERLPEVSGVLRDNADRPATAGWVILFPADKSQWTGTGRRIQGVRPGTEGRFVFRSVPPGSYLLIAADAESGQWLDPSFLEKLAPRATRITVKGNEPPPPIVLRK
jgi:hypothetical protein